MDAFFWLLPEWQWFLASKDYQEKKADKQQKKYKRRGRFHNKV
jgi:hypothetical protein